MWDEDEVVEFVDETDFDQSYLIVVVAGAWPSGYWLELGTVERIEDGLRVSVATASPDEPVGDDAAVHSLAIRVTDEQSDVPDRIEVTINGRLTGTAESD